MDPIKQTKSVTLYETLDTLAALAETDVDQLSESEKAELIADVGSAIKANAEKCDRVAMFILGEAARGKFWRDVARDMTEKARIAENNVDRVRAYVAGILQALPRDQKGKPAKAIGTNHTMSLRAKPAFVEIDPEAVSDEYKNVTVTMKLELWKQINEELTLDERELGKIVFSIDEAALKAATKDGHEVPGTSLLVGEYSLVVK